MMKIGRLVSLAMMAFLASGAEAREVSKKGRYLVPTPLALVQQATLEVPEVTVTLGENGRVQGFRFKLPPELGGPEGRSFGAELRSEVAQSFLHMRGGNGEAMCTPSYFQLFCSIRYSSSYSSGINRPARQEYLKRRYPVAAEYQVMASVADVFSNDPHGLLIIEMRDGATNHPSPSARFRD